ncbi:MAG TPA: hypothetical protein VLB27_08005 [candidate division Zixibacteria bacterium]|nr:hypothetical protein [candidate division Zixibacteria bacterium]
MKKRPTLHRAPLALIGLTTLFLALSAGSCQDTNPPTGGGGGDGATPDTLTRLTFDGGYNPTVSPDSDRVAFQLLGGGIAVLHLASGVIDSVFLFGSEPDWSPDPDSILYLFGGIRLASLTTQGSFPLINNSNVETPEWSHDGWRIVSHGTSPDGLYLTSVRSGQMEMVTCTTDAGDPCAGEHPSYSGLGDYICFEDGLEIMRVAPTGGIAETIVANLRDVTEPSYSPDGLFIAFAMQGLDPATTHIWVSDAQSQDSGLWQVTDGAVRDRSPAWGPNSHFLYFERSDTALGSQTDIWRIGFDTAGSL